MKRVALTLVSLIIVGVPTLHARAQAGAGEFFVDCSAGSDSAAGTSPASAWKSLSRAENASLQPGDSLLLKRGCRWRERLMVDWDGTASAPIRITGYGTGTSPEIRDRAVVVTGGHIIVEGLNIDHDPVDFDPCGQPLGQYYGIVITQGGHHAVIRHNVVQHKTAGLHISKTAGNNNRVLHNVFANNNVMQAPFDGHGDLGAWGVLVRRDHNEFAFNTFQNNRAVCRKATYIASNSIEIYEGIGNTIHHNTAIGDRVFSELGSSSTRKAADNYYAFNVHHSNVDGARFITTRGPKDTTFGPVTNTIAERNTIHYTGTASEGLVCSRGCTPDILTARYNIIDTVFKAIYYDDTMGQTRNIIWSNTGDIRIQDGGNLRALQPGDRTDEYIVADPQFTDPTTANLTIQPTSPAIDHGGPTRYTTDHTNTTITNTPDIGAHEHGTGTPGASPQPPPIDPVDPWPDLQRDPTATPNAELEPLLPARVLDTRGLGTIDGLGHSQRLRADTPVRVRIAGRGGVSADATAAVLNLVAVQPSAPGFVVIYPCSQHIPTASTINFYAGDVIANSTIAKLDSNGDTCISSSTDTDIVIDVTGSLVGSSGIDPLLPARVLDTRGLGTIDGLGHRQRLRADTPVRVRIAGRGGVSADATAAVLNLVAVQPSAPGFVVIYPCSQHIPTASTINFYAGDVIANSTIAKLDSNGDTCISSSTDTDIVIDVTAQY